MKKVDEIAALALIVAFYILAIVILSIMVVVEDVVTRWKRLKRISFCNKTEAGLFALNGVMIYLAPQATSFPGGIYLFVGVLIVIQVMCMILHRKLHITT